MKLLVKILDENLREKYLARKNYSTDSGFDLHTSFKGCVDDKWFVSNKAATKIPLGVACAPVFEEGEKPHGYYLYPRSSISKTPFRLANSVGIIDAGYRGEICAMVYSIVDNFDIINTEATPALFQLCSPDLTPIEVEYVDELPTSERGENGFGSTNKA